MRLGVAYDVLRWEERDLFSEAKKLGYDVRPLYIKDYADLIGNSISENLDAVIQRGVSHSRALVSTALLESQGLRVFNDSLTLVRCENKAITLSLLAKSGVSIPRTAIAFSKEKALEIARKLGYPVVIKPIEGSWGRMVAKAVDDDSLYSLMEYQDYTTLQFRTAYMVQEFVRKPDRDIRIFVIGDEAPVGIYRVNKTNWKTNTALGAKAEPLKIDSELRELALKVKDVIGGFFLGIDVFEDPDRGYVVNEVNGVPEYKNTVRVNNFNVSGFLLKKLAEVIKK
ncbi:MAG: lysine biosynthesis protein LysX [Sulfolobales archaeon]|nr:lysine biosynthesis protein LysX [Sulfolobales archaeon]MCG2894330.1 lysine biosynthesis protein LysX [Sulfolobales archaeon]